MMAAGCALSMAFYGAIVLLLIPGGTWMLLLAALVALMWRWSRSDWPLY